MLSCVIHHHCYESVATSDEKSNNNNNNDDIKLSINEDDFNRPTPFEQNKIFPSKKGNKKNKSISLDSEEGIEEDGIELASRGAFISNVKPINRIKEEKTSNSI